MSILLVQKILLTRFLQHSRCHILETAPYWLMSKILIQMTKSKVFEDSSTSKHNRRTSVRHVDCVLKHDDASKRTPG